MSDLRNRALRAAEEQAARHEKEAAEAERREQLRREQLAADAEALCERELGIKAKFVAGRYVTTSIEGVPVFCEPPSTYADGRVKPARLSHDLARLGVDIKAREASADAARKEREREAELVAWRKSRTCDWCGELARMDPRDHAEALAAHKKWDCRKVPRWRRRWGHMGYGTG